MALQQHSGFVNGVMILACAIALTLSPGKCLAGSPGSVLQGHAHLHQPPKPEPKPKPKPVRTKYAANKPPAPRKQSSMAAPIPPAVCKLVHKGLLPSLKECD
jgi:hypothetical protein